MRAPVLAAAFVMSLTAACGGGASEEEVQQAVEDALAKQDQTTTPAAPPAEPTEAAAAPSPTADTVNFAMPDLRGQDLQTAQNTVQQHGVFFSVSHDLISSHNQVLDANWIVCTQTPAPGTQVTGPASEWEGRIDFGVVKLDENCP